ncbi:hypothetical protein [Rhizobium grahamii]|uniref:hypothetical protein n=1 Tax=Rhizobium grahamii TaxID=1120045 RepID=UPI0011B02DBE|nr:hypothetical protein [Rhizobium grahamii]
MESHHINRYRHGWASLKIRCPSFRAWEGKQHRVRELCEVYSEAISFRELVSKQGEERAVIEYDEFCRTLEQEVRHYLIFYQDHPEAGTSSYSR